MSTAAVILAAGFSTRMGRPNKLLAEVGGEAILRRVIKNVLDIVDLRPVVVVGADAANVSDDITVSASRQHHKPRSGLFFDVDPPDDLARAQRIAEQEVAI